MKLRKRIVIVGGCGHVGLPLGVKFALAGADVRLIDCDSKKVETVNAGIFPFLERGGDEQLAEALKRGLKATVDIKASADADVIVFVTGTPVDEHLNAKLSEIYRVFEQYEPYFSKHTLIVMRSTLFPGTMEHLHNRLQDRSLSVKMAFCPERVSQGYALEEIDSLPQVVSAFDEESFQLAQELFSLLAPSIIRLTPLEAEFTKLMANSWRYLEFAIANQFYMIAEKSGVDFYRVFDAIRYDYPRANGYKAPGFAAGPCLFKDTMQLASYFDHQFYLGHSAMLVNESLATFAVERAKKLANGSLRGKRVGLLGMTFKPNNDDVRESLSFRVKKGLEFQGCRVSFHDPFLQDSTPLDQLLEDSELFVLCTPHEGYRKLELAKPVVDVWGFFPREELEVLPGKAGLKPEKIKSVG